MPANVSNRGRAGATVMSIITDMSLCFRPLQVARSTLSTRVLLNLRTTASTAWRGGLNTGDSAPTGLFYGLPSSRVEHGEVPSNTALGLDDDGTGLFHEW